MPSGDKPVHSAPLHWPALPSPYNEGLQAAVTDLLATYVPLGLFAAGSVLRGQGGPTSDIDLYLIHQAPFRQRLQRRYNAVPFEIFINPPQQVRRYFIDEHSAARPITAHMLATGFVLIDRDPVIQDLRNEAAQWLATPPNPTPDALRWRRYMAVDLLDNARDVVTTDPAMATLLLHRVVEQLIEYRFLAANRHLPRLKETLSALASLDRQTSELVDSFLAADGASEQLVVVNGLAESVTGETSFFAWDGEPEVISNDFAVNL